MKFNKMFIFSETSNHWFKKQSKSNNLKLISIGLNNKKHYNKIKWKHGFHVINLSQKTPGTHWTVLAIPKNLNCAYYFDSYGVVPDDSLIESLKKQNINNIYFNQYAVQSLNSKACGYFCLAFMLAMQENINLNNYNFFIDYFTPYALKNEKLLLNFFNKNMF